VLSVDEARAIVLRDVPPPREIDVDLAAAAGSVLAEEVRIDRDLPPFDRAMMDGYAVRSADVGPRRVVEDIPAGRPASRPVGPGEASKIMTGAPMPEGADAVMPVEKADRAGELVTLREAARPGLHVAPRGSDLPKGALVLGRGHLLRPAEIGALAAAGRPRVKVFARPRVAVVATGDELVPAGAEPGPGQIRNSNGPMIAAQVRGLGLDGDDLGQVGDDRDAIRAKIREGLKRDVVILSGGVSAGDWDLVIPALEAEGIALAMHRVAIKPGKPFCFGPGVFGLPGNPVSAFVIFEVFVRPHLGRRMGADLERPRVRARLEGPGPKPVDRTHYLPARVRMGDDASAELLPWKGSADLFAVTKANAFAVIPPGAAVRRGERVECLLL
jgi:molybdopterin molybdotransferase